MKIQYLDFYRAGLTTVRGHLRRLPAILRLSLLAPVLALFLLSNSPVMAQGPTPVPPDCVIFINNWVANQASAPFANYFNGCVNWVMAISPASTVTGLSLRFESAPAMANTPSPGTPGTFVAYAGTVNTGVNPIISTAGGVTTFSNGTVEIPWVRAHLTGYTGTGAINGVIYGYKQGYSGSGGGGGAGCPNPCPVINGPSNFSVQGETASGSPPTTPPLLAAGSDGTDIRTVKTDTGGDVQIVGPSASGTVPSTNPVLAAGFDGTNLRTIKTDTSGNQFVDGPAAVGGAAPNPLTTGYRDSAGNVLADYGFPQQAQVTLAAGTDVVIVAGVASTNTYVGSLSFAADSGQTVTIQQGTGTTCGSNTLVLAGPYQLTTALALDFDSKKPLHTTVAARDLCIHFGGSVTAGGLVVYGTH